MKVATHARQYETLYIHDIGVWDHIKEVEEDWFAGCGISLNNLTFVWLICKSYVQLSVWIVFWETVASRVKEKLPLQVENTLNPCYTPCFSLVQVALFKVPLHIWNPRKVFSAKPITQGYYWSTKRRQLLLAWGLTW